jgi:hypothetical protein
MGKLMAYIIGKEVGGRNGIQAGIRARVGKYFSTVVGNGCCG